ncbi:MAG: hypothetical protein SGI86_20190 [Deltaproteobacteria bacterium]|nr:hypothetical protein [Deltaproteobacteria bacterium]
MARVHCLVALALSGIAFGCAATPKDELGFPDLAIERDDHTDKAPSAAREKNTTITNAQYRFRWILPPMWTMRDPVKALPALAQFEGGSALCARHDKLANALLLVVETGGNAESNPQNRASLEQVARKKSLEQKISVDSLEATTLDGHDAVRLIGRQGGRNAPLLILIFVHADSRRFELQCQRAADADFACNTAFDGLKLSAN